MRQINRPLYQFILNKAIQKLDFTFMLKNSQSRYIVSHKNIYTGTNPSLEHNLITRISEAINIDKYTSIGGWHDKETNLYYLDCNLHFRYLRDAIDFAKLNNQKAIFDRKTNRVINIKYHD